MRKSDIQKLGGAFAGQVAALAARKVGAKTFGRQLARRTKGGAVSTGFAYAGARVYSDLPWARAQGPHGWHINDFRQSLDWCGWAHDPEYRKFIDEFNKVGRIWDNEHIRWAGPYASSGQTEGTIVFNKTMEDLPDQFQSWIKDPGIVDWPARQGLPDQWGWSHKDTPSDWYDDDERYLEPWIGDNWDHIGTPFDGRGEFSGGYPELDVQPMNLGEHCIFKFDWDNPIWDFDEHGQQVAFVPLSVHPSVKAGHIWNKKDWHDHSMVTHIDGQWMNYKDGYTSWYIDALVNIEASTQQISRDDMFEMLKKTGKIWNDTRRPTKKGGFWSGYKWIDRGWRHVFDRPENYNYCQTHNVPYIAYRHKLADEVLNPKVDYGSVGTTSPTRTGGDPASDLGLILEHIPNFQLSVAEQYIYEMAPVVVKNGGPCVMMYNFMNMHNDPKVHSNIWDAKAYDWVPGLGGKNIGQNYKHTVGFRTYAGSINLMCQQLMASTTSEFDSDHESTRQSTRNSVSFSSSSTEVSESFKLPGLESSDWLNIKQTHTSVKEADDIGEGYINMFTIPGTSEQFTNNPYITLGYDWVSDEDSEYRYTSYQVDRNVEYWDGTSDRLNDDKIKEQAKLHTAPSISRNESEVGLHTDQLNYDLANVDEYTLSTRIDYSNTMAKHVSGKLKLDRIKLHQSTFCKLGKTVDMMLSANIEVESDIIIRIFEAEQEDSSDSEDQTPDSAVGSGSGVDPQDKPAHLKQFRLRKVVGKILEKITFENIDVDGVRFEAFLVEVGKGTNPKYIKYKATTNYLSGCEFEKIDILSDSSGFAVVNEFNKISVVKSDASVVYDHPLTEESSFLLSLVKSSDGSVSINIDDQQMATFKDNGLVHSYNVKNKFSTHMYETKLVQNELTSLKNFIYSEGRDEFEKWSRLYQRGKKTTYVFVSPCEVVLTNATPVHENGFRGWNSEPTTSRVLKRFNSDYAISGAEDGNEIKSIVEEPTQSVSSVTEDGDLLIPSSENDIVMEGLAGNLVQAFGVISATQGYTDGFWAQLGWSTLGLGLFLWDLFDVLTLGTAAVTLGIIKWGIRLGKGGGKLYLKVGSKTLTRSTLRGAFSKSIRESAQVEWTARWYKTMNRWFTDPDRLKDFKSIHVHRVLPLPKFRTATDGRRILIGWSWPYSSLTPNNVKNLFFDLFAKLKYQPHRRTHGVDHATNLVDDVAHQMLGIKGGHWDECPDSVLGAYLNSLTLGIRDPEKIQLAMVKGLQKLHDNMLRAVDDPANIAVWTLQKMRAKTAAGPLHMDIGWITQIQKELAQVFAPAAVPPAELKAQILSVFTKMSDLAPAGKQLTKKEVEEFGQAIDDMLKVGEHGAPMNPTDVIDGSVTNLSRIEGELTENSIDGLRAAKQADSSIDPEDLNHVGSIIFKSFLETQMNQVINYGLEPFARYSDILKSLGREAVESSDVMTHTGGLLYVLMVSIVQNPRIPSRMLVDDAGELVGENAETIITKFAQRTESEFIRSGREGAEGAAVIPLTTTTFSPHASSGAQIAKQSTKAGDGLLPKAMATRKMTKEMVEELDDILLQYEQMRRIFVYLLSDEGIEVMKKRSLWDDSVKNADGMPEMQRYFVEAVESGKVPASVDHIVKRNCPVVKTLIEMTEGPAKTQVIDDILRGIERHIVDLQVIQEGLVPAMARGKQKITATVQTVVENGVIIIAGKRATLPSGSGADVIGKMFSSVETLRKVARGAWDEIEDVDELLDFAAGVADAGLPQWADGGQLAAALGGDGIDLLRPAGQQHKFGFEANREVGKVFLQMLARVSDGHADEFGRGVDDLWQESAFDEATDLLMGTGRPYRDGEDVVSLINHTMFETMTKRATAMGISGNIPMGVLIHQAWGAAQNARKAIKGYICRSSEITIKPGDKLYDELANRIKDIDGGIGEGLTKQQWAKRGVHVNEKGDGLGSIELIVDHGFGPNVKYVKATADNPTLYKVPEKDVEKAVKNWMKGEHAMVDPANSFKLLDNAAADGKVADFNQVINLFKRLSPHFADNVDIDLLRVVNKATDGPRSILRDSGIAITIKGGPGDGRRVLATLPVVPTNPRSMELIADAYNHSRSILELFMTSNVMTQKMMREALERLAKNVPPETKVPPGFLFTAAGADSVKRSGILRSIVGTMESAGNILKHMSSKRHWPHAMPVVGGVCGIAHAFDSRAKNATKHISYSGVVTDVLDDIATDSPNILKTYQYYHYYENTTTTGLSSEGQVEIRRSDSYNPNLNSGKGISQTGAVATYYYDEKMALIGVELPDPDNSPVQQLIDSDDRFMCISKKQYDQSQNDDAAAYEWMRQCHGELVGLVVDPSGLTFDDSKTEITKTDTNGESWQKLYEPYTVTINSYGHTSTTTRYNTYWKAPDGSIYDEQPDFL